MFFAPISAEMQLQFIIYQMVFIYQMFRQGEDHLSVKNMLIKVINRHILQFKKHNIKNRSNSSTINITF